MHLIEPYYNWRDHYISSEDPRSPFFEREYSEFSYSQVLYNHYIHPQWDDFGSTTLFLKIIYCDYEEGFCVIEIMGEWNDCLYNDIMTLKREIIEPLMMEGVSKFILIGENVLTFHCSDECYYEEWFEEVEDQDGWVALVNFNDHVLRDMMEANIDSYFVTGGRLNDFGWRPLTPSQVFGAVSEYIEKRLGPVV
ncbi:MAG: hypothetical protein KDC12_11855 [Flavobacteriales bacterium]|nr:hypothetical protein [Flavobacteriales bacterium]